MEGGYGRTGSRSPMQWDSTANNGFSSAAPDKLYIKMDPSADRPTVEAQMADETSLYHEIRRLIAVRQAHPALQSKGEIEFVYAKENAYPLAYLRSCDSERILVVINPSAEETRFELKLSGEESGSLQDGGVIYSYGAAAHREGSAWIAPPCSVSFILL